MWTVFDGWVSRRFRGIRTRAGARMQNRGRDKERGLTLIELLVVVVILGILATVAVPSVVAAVNSARVNSTESTLSTLQTALERYRLDHGQYPQNLGALYSVPGSTGGQSSSTSSNASNSDNGPYVSSGFPQYDGWGNAIYYAALQNGTGYLLVSGDGTSLSGSAFTLSGTANYVYAAGGTDGTAAIGQTPEVGTLSSANNPALLTDFQNAQFSSR